MSRLCLLNPLLATMHCGNPSREIVATLLYRKYQQNQEISMPRRILTQSSLGMCIVHICKLHCCVLAHLYDSRQPRHYGLVDELAMLLTSKPNCMYHRVHIRRPWFNVWGHYNAAEQGGGHQIWTWHVVAPPLALYKQQVLW